MTNLDRIKMMTKDFEKYFPLPWTVIEHKNGAFMKQNAAPITGKKGYKESVELGLVEEFSVNSFPPRVAALKYAVKCANLMPEAVEVIRDLVKIVSQPDYDPDSLDYSDHVVRRAEELLAKLEGGAEDA